MRGDRPFLLVQLSDPHIGAGWGASDALLRFRASVAAVRGAGVGPDVVVVSGDLADHEGDAPIGYAGDVGPVRLLMLDSSVPGQDHGDLDRDQLDWLEALRDASERPTILVMHHPPLRCGVAAFDSIALADGARLELARILTVNNQVLAVLSGHFHRAIATTIGGRAALTVPSTYVQARLDLAATELVFAEEEPPAFAVHTLLDGCLTSHIQVVL